MSKKTSVCKTIPTRDQADQLRLERICADLKLDKQILTLPPERALQLVEGAQSARRKAIIESTAQDRHELAYYPSFLCCLALPAKRVAEPVYVRESPRYKLKIASAYTVPYGIYPRLLIAAMATAVTKRKNSGEDTTKLYLGESFYSVVKKLLGADTLSGGPRGNATRFKEQYRATITATIYWWQHKDRLPVRYAIADDWREEEHLLWRVDKDNDDRPVFMPGRPVTLTLGKYFHQDLIDHSPQIDFGIFRELARTKACLPVDLYVWLTYMANGLRSEHRIEKRLSWENLKMQFGASYARMDHFREQMRPALHLVGLYYRGFTFEEVRGGHVVFTLRRPSVAGPYTMPRTGTDGGAGLVLPSAPAEQGLLKLE
jgi:hypothetical protein